MTAGKACKKDPQKTKQLIRTRRQKDHFFVYLSMATGNLWYLRKDIEQKALS
jgi:hypothetical protein